MKFKYKRVSSLGARLPFLKVGLVTMKVGAGGVPIAEGIYH